MQWNVTDVFGRKPSSVHLHACAHSTSGTVFLYGGREERGGGAGGVAGTSSGGNSGVSSELFSLSRVGEKLSWRSLAAPGLYPARYGHSMVHMEDELVVFGGCDEKGAATNSLFTLKMDRSSAPSLVVAAADEAGMPSPRSEHSMMATSSKSFIVFGGKDASGAFLGDVWSCTFDQDTAVWKWRLINAEGKKPTPRSGSLLFQCSGARVCLFGGVVGEGRLSNELYILDTAKGVWCSSTQTGEIPPATQAYHGVQVHGCAIITGERGPLRGYYIRDVGTTVETVTWESFKASGAVPSLSGFCLSFMLGEGGVPFLTFLGGRPCPFKDRIAFYSLSLGSFIAAETVSSPRSSGVAAESDVSLTPTKGGKFGTLKNIFRKKDESKADGGAGGAATLGHSASKGKRSSTLSRGSGGMSFPSFASGDPASPKGEAPERDTTSPRAHSRKASLAGVPSGLASPTSARKRVQGDEVIRSDHEQLQATLLETQEALRNARLELIVERKVIAASRDEQLSPKGEAALAMRKLLEDEVRNAQALQERVQILEAEQSGSQQQLQALKMQFGELKVQHAVLQLHATSMETKHRQVEEALRESQAARQKYQEASEKKLAEVAELEQARLRGAIASMKNRIVHDGAVRMLELIQFLQHEYSSLLTSIVLPDHVASRARQLEDESRVRLRQCKIQLGLEKQTDSSFSLTAATAKTSGESGESVTEGAVDGDDSNSGPATPHSGQATPHSGQATPHSGSGQGTPTSLSPARSMVTFAPRIEQQQPKQQKISKPATELLIAKHGALLREVDALNVGLDKSVSLRSWPLHDVSEEIQSCSQQRRNLLRRQTATLPWLVSEALLMETQYADYLQTMLGYYRDPLVSQELMDTEVVNEIFGNIPSLLQRHLALLQVLQPLQETPLAFFAAYAQEMNGILNLYDEFVTLLPTMLVRYAVAFGRRAKPRVRDFLQGQARPSGILDLRAALCHPLITLQSYWDIFSLASDLKQEESLEVVQLSKKVLEAIPIGIYRDAAEQACSTARLMYLDIWLKGFHETLAAGSSHLWNGRRFHYFEAKFVLTEMSADLEGFYSAPMEVSVIFCSDALVILEPQRELDEKSCFRLHEVIPLQQLDQFDSLDGSLRVGSKGRTPNVVYCLYGSASDLEQMGSLIHKSLRLLVGTGSADASEMDSDGLNKFLDSDQICYIREGENVTVRGGLPLALLQWVILDIPADTVVKYRLAVAEILQFLQAARKDFPPALIFDTMQAFCKRPNATQRELARCAHFAKLWVTDFCLRDLMDATTGPDSPLFQKMLRWAIRTSVEHPELVVYLNPVKLGLLRGVGEWNAAKSLRGPYLEVTGPAEDLERCHPLLFGEQLTLAVHRLFSVLTDEDLYIGDKSPSVVAMIKLWNSVFDWSLSYLNHGLGGQDDLVVLGRVKRLLMVAKCCLDNRNYDSAFALGLAFDQCKISKVVKELLRKTPDQQIWDNLTSITNVSRGFYNYRCIVDALQPPAIPYLAISLKDIVLIRENDSKIENSDMLNYRKLVILGSRLRFLRRFRRAPYPDIVFNDRAQRAFVNLLPVSKPALSARGTTGGAAAASHRRSRDVRGLIIEKAGPNGEPGSPKAAKPSRVRSPGRKGDELNLGVEGEEDTEHAFL